VIIVVFYCTSISANPDGLHSDASRRIDHITLLIGFNYQATSVGW